MYKSNETVRKYNEIKRCNIKIIMFVRCVLDLCLVHLINKFTNRSWYLIIYMNFLLNLFMSCGGMSKSIRYMYRYILLYNNTVSPNNVIANVYFEPKQGEAVSRRHNIYLTD